MQQSHVFDAVFGVCAFRVHRASAGTSGVLLDSGTVKWGRFGAELTQTDACCVNPSWSCGAGLSRAQRHHTAWMLLASSLFMWSELTA